MTTINKGLTDQIQQIRYLIQRLTTIRNRMKSEEKAVEADLARILADAAYALGIMATSMNLMEAEHEKMKMVLRWFVKGDLEEHLDEVRAFIESE